jgi:DNA processing protein
MKDLELWLTISEYCKFSMIEIRSLLTRLGTLENIWNADDQELLKSSESMNLSRQIIDVRKRVSPEVQKSIIDLSQSESIRVIPMISEDYPSCLHSIERPPKTLFMRGDLKALKKEAIAIVGTRKPSNYAKSKVREIACTLVAKGYTIVSGLAEGIDTEAHFGALEGKGLTTAILPSGVLHITPPSNIPLAEEILNSNGAILSEFGLETPPMRFRFIERNRVISGLSQAIIVAEGSLKSGTRHTVDFAKNQERCLLALSPINNEHQTELPKSLHAEGVEYVSSSEDVINAIEKWKLRDKYQQTSLE